MNAWDGNYFAALEWAKRHWLDHPDVRTGTLAIGRYGGGRLLYVRVRNGEACSQCRKQRRWLAPRVTESAAWKCLLCTGDAIKVDVALERTVSG